MAGESDFVMIEDDVRERLQAISVCREATCPVAQKQPFYPTLQAPPFYYGKRPCMPVVPTYAKKGSIMLIGEYPNCRFGRVDATDASGGELFIPVGDINEPFESGRYFDGGSVSKYPTGQTLYDYYLTPLKINLAKDVWFTNVVKCFLMRDYQIENYKRVGWVDSNNKWLDSDTNQQKPISHAYDDYFDIAAICMRKHLFEELDLCRPKLIIAFGTRAYQMIHSDSNLTPLAPPNAFGPITGLPMRAKTASPSQFDHRHPNFKPYNVVHLYHPSTFVRTDEISPEITATHEASLAKTRAFMSELGLS